MDPADVVLAVTTDDPQLVLPPLLKDATLETVELLTLLEATQVSCLQRRLLLRQRTASKWLVKNAGANCP